MTTTVRFGEKGKGYFKWARADIVFFCSSRGKKTRAHKWRERERGGRAAETENTASVLVPTLPLHLIVKERAQHAVLSFPLR